MGTAPGVSSERPHSVRVGYNPAHAGQSQNGKLEPSEDQTDMSSLDARSFGAFPKVVLTTDGPAESVARWIVGRVRNLERLVLRGRLIFMRMALLGATSASWLPKRGARG
jgi:hypothetical protein